MIVAGLACGIRLQWLVGLGFGRQAGNHKNGRAGTQHMADRVGSSGWAAVCLGGLAGGR